MNPDGITDDNTKMAGDKEVTKKGKRLADLELHTTSTEALEAILYDVVKAKV